MVDNIDFHERVKIRCMTNQERLQFAEMCSRHDSKLTIWKDRVEVVNWNIPYGYGLITLDNLRPHAKNPAIANFFAQLGIVEELGRGTRALFEYVPKISGGQMPVIEEKDEFRVVIPYQEVTDDTQNDTQKSTNDTLNQKSRRIKLVEIINDDEHITVETLANKLKVSVITIKRDLKALGIKWEGPSKTGLWIKK